ncbi:MAG: hypothetical protein P4M09_18940 [Devosia sp.]|nr:hypothetical protein [Devosia sp.]
MAYPDLSFLIPSQAQCWYAVLKDFQSGVTGLLGFVGVMLTLWWNGRISRVGRAETQIHHRNTLRVALAEELSLIEEDLLQRLDIIGGNIPPTAVSFAPMVPTEIYSAVIKDIGVLQADQVRALIRGYYTVGRLDAALSQHVAKIDDNGRLYIERPKFRIAYLYLNTALQHVQEALDLMGPEYKTTPRPAVVGTGQP